MSKPKEILELEKYWGIEIENRHYLVNEKNEIINLTLSGEKIEELSPISALIKIEQLYLFNTSIYDLSPLKDLQNLFELRVIGSKINDISPLSSLRVLEILELSSCNIDDKSLSVALRNVRRLIINNNLVKELTQLLKWPRLERVLVEFNQIKEISQTFIQETNFDYHFFDAKLAPMFFNKNRPYIDITGNPIQYPPIPIIQQGREAMLQWWERTEKEGIKPLNEVRVLFLGWGNAGKTSVMRRLIGQEPTQGDEDSTHGINLVPWQVKTASEQNVKVNLWDFGGQEIQHHTHQFFLAEDCIYVVVVNNRENDEPRYWLEYIRTMANAAPTILLFNKTDQARNTQHNVTELMRDYPFIKHTFEIVAARPKSDVRAEEEVYYRENVAAFCTALRRQIEIHRFVATDKYPETTFTVKEWVEAETQLGKNHISKKAFRLACESRGVNEIEQKSWLDIFKKIGVITYVEQNLHLDKLLILNPEWMTFAVYRILLHPKTKALQGIISKNDLRELLYQDDTDREAFRKKYQYEDEDFGSIIEIMKEYKLCYTQDNRTLMIPSAFPNNYNSPLEDRTDGLNLKISFKKFLPPSIVNTLIVDLMNQQKIRKSWASGMEVWDKDIQTEALVKFSNFEREINIKVFGERSRELMTLIRHEIKNIKRTFSDTLEMEEMVPIPNKPNRFVAYSTLLNYERKGQEKYIDEDVEDHTVKLLLENIEVRPQINLNELLELLEQIQKQTNIDYQWRKELLEAIQEINELRTSSVTPQQTAWSLRKIFEGMKDGKDIAEILVLAPDFAEKWAKLQSAYEIVKHTLGW